ncbi:hypothetical protein [Mesobacillus maritimus]|uniref:hypothetical protein n=1 Tax=Mesobacillus maritimus TaxID=1643336 RepID=UPI00384B734C
MKKYEVIESEEMLRCEIIENYYVVYEKTESMEYRVEHDTFFEKGCSIEKTVTIYKGSSQSTLQKVHSYTVDFVDQSGIRDVILQDYPELFKGMNQTKKAV